MVRTGHGRHNAMERHVRDAHMFTIAGDMAQFLRALRGMKVPETRDVYLKAAYGKPA